MSKNIFIITASSPRAKEHIYATIDNHIPKEKVEIHFSESELEEVKKIGNIHDYYAWRAKEGDYNIRIWNIMQRGDHLLVYQNKKYTYYSKIAFKSKNKEFALDNWKTDDDGKTWEYMYLLEKPVKFTNPIDVSSLVPYLSGAYRGFTRTSDNRLEKIFSDFGSLGNFFKTKIPEVKAKEIKFPNYWWVNQGDSFKESMEQKVLRAPKSDTIYHWQNMEKVKEGDIIFNYADGYIRAISIAISKFYDSEIESGVHAGKPGNKIDINIYDIDNISLSSLQNPINYKQEKLWQGPKEYIQKTLGDIMGPFDVNINIKQGYLFELNYDLAKKIREIYGKPFPEPIERFFADSGVVKRGVEIIKDPIKDLLLSKKQIILYGPPGTGKTYNTKKIAVNVLGKK